MRIACLQFAPQVGDVDNNLNRAVRLPLLQHFVYPVLRAITPGQEIPQEMR